MAAKFVVAVALFAVCHANLVLYNGVLSRDGRSYAISQANGNGANIAQANVQDNVAQAYGSSYDGAQLARNAYFPGQANAQAQTYGAGHASAQAQNQGYYRAPAPATVIAYQQNFAIPSYTNGAAESFAQTRGGSGSYDITSTKAASTGYGSASSNANSGLGSTRTSANTQGYGFASSNAQTNGVPSYIVGVEQVPQEFNVIEAKTPIFQATYVPSTPVASSNANVNGVGNAVSSAKISHGRTISWRFGTLYDNPTNAYAQAKTQSAYGAAKSATHTHGYGSAKANAGVNGGYGQAKSSANTNGAGSAIANAVNGAGYGAAKSAATSQLDTAESSANTNSGSANSIANVHGLYGVSRTSAATRGHGNASSSARTQGLSTAFKVTNSQASSRFGSAHANSQIV